MDPQHLENHQQWTAEDEARYRVLVQPIDNVTSELVHFREQFELLVSDKKKLQSRIDAMEKEYGERGTLAEARAQKRKAMHEEVMTKLQEAQQLVNGLKQFLAEQAPKPV